MIYELAVMLLLATGGTSLAWLLGARNLWLTLPFGLTAVITLRMLTFAAAYPLGLASQSHWVLFVLLAAAILWAAVKFGKQLLGSMVLSIAAAGLAVGFARGLAIKPITHSDSSWILAMSYLFEKGGNLGLLAHKVQFKRGFDYPLMLALGPSDEYLSAFTPYVFVAIMASVVWAVNTLIPASSKKVARIYLAVILAVVFTAPVTWRSIAYINGHTLTALGITLIAVAVIHAIREKNLTNSQLILISLSVAVVSTTRPEGILVSAMAMLPLLQAKFIKRWQLAVLSSSATVTLSLWLILYNSYVLEKLHIPGIAFYPAMIIAGVLPWLKWFDALRTRLVAIALVSMALVIVAAQVVFAHGMQTGNRALVQNLVFGSGQWGLLFVFLFVVFIATGFRAWTSEYRALVQISATLVLSFVIAKMLDGGQSGKPDLGRVGWSDSLNRMWIHLVPVLVVTALVGLVERHQRLHLVKGNTPKK